jgi:hypothetical protein
MSQEAREFILFRTVLVALAVVVFAAIGALISVHWAVGLGVAQFIIAMAITHERRKPSDQSLIEPILEA